METGKRLGTLRRGDDEEMHINWDEYNGYPFVSLKMWKRNSEGQWWPEKNRALSIRVRELSDFSDAVMAALEEAAAMHDPGEPSL